MKESHVQQFGKNWICRHKTQWPYSKSTVETLDNDVIGTWRFCFLYQVSSYILSVVNKQYKTKQFDFILIGEIACYLMYFIIAELFICASTVL